MSERNDLRYASKETARWGIGMGFTVMLVLIVLSIGFTAWRMLTKPVTTAVGVVDRVVNPDHALETYRWFHEAYQQIEAKKSQIVLSKGALEAAAPDRKEARRVELLGLQQGCQTLVGQYNAKATRADTVIFQHPERFLPGNWPGDRNPLPSSVDLTECN